MKGLNEINNYINLNKGNVNSKYRLKYHMMPPIGWMNDPNGLVYFKDKYHVFYQFNPYNSLPGTMLWGHFVTDDLISYKDLNAAIIPTIEHGNIFSGGAIAIDDELVALYTLHYEHDGVKTEDIHLAKSKDGVSFEYCGCVFDNEKLPKNISRIDFRDPCPIKKGDYFYVFVGGRDDELNEGVIIVLRGKTLENLDYFFTIGPFYELGDMGECPSYHMVDGKDVLLVSGCRVAQKNNDFKNENSSSFIVGNIDFENGRFDVDFIKEIDKGDTFYAPQFINSLDEPIMIGWLEMWGKPYPTHELNHGWSGALSIPRKLVVKDNDIYQEPIDLSNYEKELGNNFSECIDLSLTLSAGGSVLISGDNGEINISLDEYLTLNTINAKNLNGCIRRTNNSFKECELRILLDVCSIEIFVDGGLETISSRIYLDGKYHISYNEFVKNVSVKEIGAE